MLKYFRIFEITIETQIQSILILIINAKASLLFKEVAYMQNLENMDLRKQIFEMHAEVCKVLANPKRLMILYLLSRSSKPLSVGDMAGRLGLSMSNLSQHLALLRARHLVRTTKKGQTVYYEIIDPRITKACDLIRSVLIDHLRQTGQWAEELKELLTPDQDVMFQSSKQ